MFFVALFSVFVNNMLFVVMLILIVFDWGCKFNISFSCLLMLFFVVLIFGGVCILIGISTNLIVYGWLFVEIDLLLLGMFDFVWIVGLVVLFGIIYMLVFGYCLLFVCMLVIDFYEDF